MLCPRCGQGNVVDAQIRKTGLLVYVCHECEASWFSKNDIGKKPFVDFGTYMESVGLQPVWTELTVFSG